MQGGWKPALVAALVLAGCLGGADDAAPADTNATTTTTAGDEGVAQAAVAAPNATTTAPPVQVEFHVSSEGFYPVNPSFAADVSEIATGSVVTVTYHNNDLNPLGKHDWVLEGVEGASTAMIDVGEEAQGRFVAPEPGEYVYFCSVEGHRGAGMEGTLTIVQKA